VAQRMLAAARDALGRHGVSTEAHVETTATARGAGGAIVLVADCGTSRLGAARVAERGVRAETLGQAAGTELARDLELGAAVDVHAADQLIVYLALASGDSSFTSAAASSHTRTAIWLAEQFLPARFSVSAPDAAGRVTVACHGPAATR